MNATILSTIVGESIGGPYSLKDSINFEANPSFGDWTVEFRIEGLLKTSNTNGNRVVHINYSLSKHKKQNRENLSSKKGLVRRSKRPCDVEATFGAIKQTKKLTHVHDERSLLR